MADGKYKPLHPFTLTPGYRRVPFRDGFGRGDGSLTGEWVYSNGVWTIASGKAVGTPGTGANLFAAGKGVFTSDTESWVAFGTNTIENDAGELKTTYVDTANGAQLYLNSTKDLSTNLTVGTWYRLEFDARVNTGTAGVTIQSGTEYYGITNITNVVAQTFSIVFRCNHATNCNVYSNGLGAGEIIWLDNLKLYRLTEADLFAGIKTKPGLFVVRAAHTVGTGEQAGAWWGDARSDPQNYLAAYYDKQRARVTLMQCLAGTKTTPIDAVATYSANALIEIRRTATTTYQVFYNNAQVGTDQAIAEAAINNAGYCGLFSTGGGAAADNFFRGTAIEAAKTAVYLGGSITYGNLASDLNTKAFVPLVKYGLNERYIEYPVTHYNKGVGGTDSWWALTRLQTDVIAYNPDLVVIDFAVNDVNTAFRKAAAEALIRRLRTALPNVKLAFIAFPHITDREGNDATNVKAGTLAGWQTLCTAYGVEFYDWAARSKALVDAGTYTCSDLWGNDDNPTDDKHPSDTGHADAAAGLLPYLANGLLLQVSQVTGDLPARIYDNGDMEQTPIARNGTDNDGETGTWSTVGGTGRQSSEADATIAWTGTFASFGWEITNQVGSMQWKVDSGDWNTVNVATASPLTAVSSFARGSHTVTFKVVSGTFRINRFLAI